MNKFIKNNISTIIGVVILLQPILDLITGICLHVFNINLTLGIIIKVLFAGFLMFVATITYKRKKLFIPYFIIILYGLFYVLGITLYRDRSIFVEVQNLVKVFYFPVLLLTLYSIKDEFKISKMILFTTLFTYIILIFIPTLFGIGFASYEITKSGTLGFYNSANEISGIISILTPIIFLIFKDEKSAIKKTILTIIYLVVILMVGTKTPLLSLFITVGVTLLYLWYRSIKQKNYKPILYTFIGIIVAIIALIIVIPKTNFYKNIQVHLDYLEVDNVIDVFKDEKLVDHFIFSSRLKFLNNKAKMYAKSATYEKLFGIGYQNKNKSTKMIEMDYFDIFYSHGIVGFLIYFGVVLTVIYKLLEEKQKLTFDRLMIVLSFILIAFLAFFTGHIITAPSVSLIVVILLLYLDKREKKDLLFASVSMDLGGIEKALLNLVNRIDLNKYNVEIILEEKKGIFLDQINENIRVTELKVNNNKNVFLRKLINYTNKLIYKIFNFKKYDFSCCYATYSFSSSKIALLSSNNTAFYVHNDYRTIYKDIDEFKNFFDSRNIQDYKNIVFVSNENRDGFVEIYQTIKDRCKVYNNFINTDEIINQSNEEINVKRKSKNTLLMYVGRLDDDAKKISRQINLVKNLKNVDLWIIGDGPDREKYEKEVKENKLEDRITFFGKQKNPFPYMKMADYCILTSDYEGFPVTYLEAITLNKNIITTFPTSDDTVDINKYGYVIDKDIDKMTKQVEKIIKENKKAKAIDLEEGQKLRMKKLERLFDEVI